MGQARSSNNRRKSDHSHSLLMLQAITIKLATEDDRFLRSVGNLILELKVDGQAVDIVNLLPRKSRPGTWKSDEILFLPTTDTALILSVFMKVSGEEPWLICSMELYGQELYSRLRRRFEIRLIGRESYPSMILNTKVMAAVQQNNQAESAEDIITHLEEKAIARIDDFERHRDLDSLNQAISQLRFAVEVTSENDLNPVRILHPLGVALTHRFEQLGRLEDIDDAVVQQQAAAILMPDEDPDKPGLLNNLGNSLQTRFERLGHLEDINTAVTRHQAVVDLTPDDHPDKPMRLNNLGNSLRTRFERLGCIEDIEDAVARQQTAVILIPDDHPEKPTLLNNLGNYLNIRFKRLGRLEDIDNAVAQNQAVVNLTPDGHPEKPMAVKNLGNSLLIRFERLGRLEDIEDAVAQNQIAVNLTRDGHPDQHIMLNDLGNSLQTRFEHLGRYEDIDNAISQQQTAVILIPDDHPDKHAWLNNLGNSLRIRFEHLGRLEDIDNAVAQNQAAVDLTPDDHPDKPIKLNNLGNSLRTRFERLGRIEDIEDAVAHNQAAANLTPDGHPEKFKRLNNLGISLQNRFERLGNLEDIENAVTQLQAAADLAPDSHPGKSTWLNNLGASLQIRFKRLGHLEDIENAVTQQQKAVILIPDGHPEKPTLLSNLGGLLTIRFDHLGRLEDIDDAVAQLQAAANLTPDGHPEKSNRLINLGNSLEHRFNHLKHLRDAEASIIQYRVAAKSSVGPPSVRFKAAKAWVDMASTTNHESLLDAYACALGIIPLVAWLGLPIAERHHHLVQIGEIARNAAAAAIEIQHYDQALEWLEQGRSIVWTQVLQLRTPVDHLREVEPELADRLLYISGLLDRGTRQNDSHGFTKLSLEEEGRRYRALATEWETLVSRARSIPDFEDFLRPPRLSRLMGAAKNGSVVVVNIAEKRCDALILPNEVDKVIHVPLPNFTLEKVAQLQVDMKTLLTEGGVRLRAERVTADGMSGDEGCKQILADLWNHLVNPVLDCLACGPCLDVDTPPRVWWSVTGPLSFLPIHAAGIYDGEKDGGHIFDRVISSYTPTLSALLEPPNASTRPFFRLLSVIEPSSGSSAIPNTEQELKHIRSRLGNRGHVVLEGAKATKANVMHEMKDCSWLHLACHGTQNLKEPTKSALLLHDGNLTLEDIIKLDLPNAEFAFLSACQTTTGDKDLTDEAVHIAGGMLLAGYRSVVATMWSIEDALAPEVADEFYRHLMKDGERADNRRAAEALHVAVKRLREEVREGKKIPMISWIPFVHLGI